MGIISWLFKKTSKKWIFSRNPDLDYVLKLNIDTAMDRVVWSKKTGAIFDDLEVVDNWYESVVDNCIVKVYRLKFTYEDPFRVVIESGDLSRKICEYAITDLYDTILYKSKSTIHKSI